MKTFLIVGSAKCVKADLAALRRIVPNFASVPVIAINTRIADYDAPIAHGCTMHPENAQPWHDARDAHPRQDGAPWLLWSGREGDGMAWIDRPVDRNFAWHGTSALFAVDVALRLLKADRVILAGCPIDDSPHYNGRHTLNDNGCRGVGFYREGWAKALPTIRHKVRSASGFTQALLGAPTADWLAGA